MAALPSYFKSLSGRVVKGQVVSGFEVAIEDARGIAPIPCGIEHIPNGSVMAASFRERLRRCQDERFTSNPRVFSGLVASPFYRKNVL